MLGDASIILFSGIAPLGIVAFQARDSSRHFWQTRFPPGSSVYMSTLLA